MPKSGQLWDPGFSRRSPLLRELLALGRPLFEGEGWPTLELYSAFVEQQRAARAAELPALRFAPPMARPRRSRGRAPLDPRQLYDGRIALEREVPCVTSSYHDLLNVLAWAAFPRAKHALHARQFRALAARLAPDTRRLPNRRTREQDALSLFDEGGSVLVTTPGFAPRLRAGEERAEWLLADAAVRVVPFGHALMEHVSFAASRVRSAALVVCLEPPLSSGLELLDRVDQILAQRLADGREFSHPDVFDRALEIAPGEAPGDSPADLRAAPDPGAG